MRFLTLRCFHEFFEKVAFGSEVNAASVSRVSGIEECEAVVMFLFIRQILASWFAGKGKRRAYCDEDEILCSGLVEQVQPGTSVKFGCGEIGDEIVVYNVLFREER